MFLQLELAKMQALKIICILCIYFLLTSRHEYNTLFTMRFSKEFMDIFFPIKKSPHGEGLSNQFLVLSFVFTRTWYTISKMMNQTGVTNKDTRVSSANAKTTMTNARNAKIK